MHELYRLTDYLNYLLTSGGRHSIHSPFVYRLYNEVIHGRASHPAFHHIEMLRGQMLASKAVIQRTDHGAGKQPSLVKLTDFTRRSSKPAKYARLLYRLITDLQPAYALELGTGTGISTLYQAAAMSVNPLISLEGDPVLADIARKNATDSGLAERVHIATGKFEDLLPQLLPQLPQLDYAFFDGNHRLDPTLDYFEQCLALAREGSLFVFDDIHWSDEMQRAWNIICRDQRVQVSIDLFALGLIYFRPGQEKEHFKLRF